MFPLPIDLILSQSIPHCQCVRIYLCNVVLFMHLDLLRLTLFLFLYSRVVLHRRLLYARKHIACKYVALPLPLYVFSLTCICLCTYTFIPSSLYIVTLRNA